MIDCDNWMKADWPAPAGVHAGTTLRYGGISQQPFDSFNLATHVGDDLRNVEQNRKHMITVLGLQQQPLWLNQQHSTLVINADKTDKSIQEPIGDASYTESTGVVCVVLTADCLPILLCDEQGKQIAAIHAGWRGLFSGIIEKTVATFHNKPILAWLGPAISQQAFEVGEEVRTVFVSDSSHAKSAFINSRAGKWSADLYLLATMRLHSAGVANVYGGSYCTFNDQDHFYSYRRSRQTGRMASLIWKE
ncbi:MAG: peptidoglycan editing factor PgeF [Methylococcales bacterium]